MKVVNSTNDSKSEDKLIRAKSVKEQLSISAPTLWRWERNGLFPKPIKVGHFAYYKQSWIDHILNQESGTEIKAS